MGPAMIVTGEARYLRTLAIDEALARNQDTFFLGEALGSTAALTDPTGALVTEYSYEPFGKTSSTGSPTANPFQYTGRENDGTGLYYYRARYYDPRVGRFTQEDPIRFGGGDVNLYAYVGNSPLGSADPLGLWKPPVHTNLTIGQMNAFGVFSQEMMDRAVGANVNVDRLSNQFNDPAHYMPGNRVAAETLAEQSLERAIQLARSGRLDEAMGPFGEGLHTVQDRYAHYEQNAGWLGHPGCDDPLRHPREVDAARDASRHYIDRFLLGIGVGRYEIR